jgi:hypothetical protein
MKYWMNGSAPMVARFASRGSANEAYNSALQVALLRSCRPTLEDTLGLLHISRLIRRHKTCHSNDLRVILVPATIYQPRTHPDIDSREITSGCKQLTAWFPASQTG